MNANVANFTRVERVTPTHCRFGMCQDSIRKAVIYIRCAKGTFYDDLQTRLKASIERRDDWQYAGAYVDVGYSGYNTERPALQRLLRECEAGAISVIVVDQFKNLSRNVDDCKKLFEVFLRTNVAVYQYGNKTSDLNLCDAMVEMPLERLRLFLKESDTRRRKG